MSSRSDSANAISPRRSRSSIVAGQNVGQRQRVANDAAELVVEPTLPQEPHRANKFAAEQHPVRGDGPLELLRALRGEGGVLLGTPRQHERAGGGGLRGVANLGDRAGGHVFDHHQPGRPGRVGGEESVAAVGIRVVEHSDPRMGDGRGQRERQGGAVQFE